MFGNISTMFTGKPHVAELGYTFLFRNYNSSLGKWSTSDPLGYPDGWNNFAYCNNWTTECIDLLGTVSYTISGVEYTFLRWEYVKTYAVISFHDGETSGENITRILWTQEFNVYQPVYSVKCVDSACCDYNKNLGIVTGELVASGVYNKSGSKSGVIKVEGINSIIGAPTTSDNLFYSVSKSKDLVPTLISTGVAYFKHIHQE